MCEGRGVRGGRGRVKGLEGGEPKISRFCFPLPLAPGTSRCGCWTVAQALVHPVVRDVRFG